MNQEELIIELSEIAKNKENRLHFRLWAFSLLLKIYLSKR